MRRTTLFIGLLVSPLLLPVAAAAANVACYDWDCTEDSSAPYTCTFDASCTQIDGQLWKYRWDFGDGSSLVLTGNPVIQHDYDGSDAGPEVQLTVIPLNDDPFSVTCEIVVYNPTGPILPRFGTCSQ